ncbi:APC family permease [Streptomyces violaceusniger]|uniref:APC family permease n=1 Tax=Streptomyces violaceusniger TaxID=68280 RepID=UPI00099615E1|nr:APC family permease [Streptomyces hygroscopicus]AQW55984.1 amino acid permease [Streptomyces hygroscopicus]
MTAKDLLPAESDVSDPGLRRHISGIQLLWISVGSIIGSGWLFGALFAAQVAGPSAVLTWIIGTAAVAVLALVHAELGGMFAVSGGTARFPHYAFGNLAGFTMGWATWLAGVTTVPIEVEAMLQYSSNYLPWLTHTDNGTVSLTLPGTGVAVLLIILFTLLNLYGIRKISKLNGAITIWKIATLVLTIVALSTRFHFDNFHMAEGGFFPSGVHGVIAALSTGGVIFTLVGFEQAVQVGGESKNPGRDIPRAVMGSLFITAALYMGLQIVFIGALSPAQLSHGWAHISFDGIFGPFAGLATLLGFTWLAWILYADAIVSPGSNGLIYVTTTSRLGYGMSQNGYVGSTLSKLHPRTGVPVYSVACTFVVSLICLLPFPGWQTLVVFITSSFALMYAGGPLALGALRRELPDHARPFRLRLGNLLAPFAFVVVNLLVYWGGWEANWKVFCAVCVGYALLTVSRATSRRPERPKLGCKSGSWVLPWLAGLAALCYVGQYNSPTHLVFGLAHIPFWWDIAVVSGWSLVIYYWAMAVRLPADEVRKLVNEVFDGEATAQS